MQKHKVSRVAVLSPNNVQYYGASSTPTTYLPVAQTTLHSRAGRRRQGRIQCIDVEAQVQRCRLCHHHRPTTSVNSAPQPLDSNNTSKSNDDDDEDDDNNDNNDNNEMEQSPRI